jgi:CRP-like cAMP-binding protein
MANWNVYIPQKYEIGLQALALEGESIGQVIKRLVLGILDGDNPSAIAAPSSDALTEIQERLEKLEAHLGDRQNDDLTQISDRLTNLERILLTEKTAKYYRTQQKMPTGLTHKEIAETIGSSERTMQRVAKEKERWQEGYHWSEESKKWFLLEG